MGDRQMQGVLRIDGAGRIANISLDGKRLFAVTKYEIVHEVGKVPQCVIYVDALALDISLEGAEVRIVEEQAVAHDTDTECH